MKQKIVILLLIACSAFNLLIGCEGKKNSPESKKVKSESAKEVSFVSLSDFKEQEPSDFMQSVKLSNKEGKSGYFRCLSKDFCQVSDSFCYGSEGGITTEVRLTAADNKMTAKSEVSDSMESKTLSLNGTPFYSDITQGEAIVEENSIYQVLSYKYKSSEEAEDSYDCYYIVKVEEIEGVLLKIFVDVDTSQFTDSSENILKEVENAYGVKY